MRGIDVLLTIVSIVIGLAINEMSDVSPWLARVLVRRAAYMQHGGTTRAEIEAEDLQALIGTRPGKLLKLFTSLGFLAAAVPAWIGRKMASRLDYRSGATAEWLFPTEKFRGEWVRHWINPAKSVALNIIVAAAGSFSAVWYLHGPIRTLAVVGILVGLVTRCGCQMLAWRSGRFVITNKRVVVMSGFLSRTVAMMPLARVTDMKYVQSPVGRFLNYGTFVLESAGRTQALRSIKDLPNPAELYVRLVEEMYEPEAVEARTAQYRSDEGDDQPTRAAHDLRERVVGAVEHLPDEQLKAFAVLLGLSYTIDGKPTDTVQGDDRPVDEPPSDMNTDDDK